MKKMFLLTIIKVYGVLGGVQFWDGDMPAVIIIRKILCAQGIKVKRMLLLKSLK